MFFCMGECADTHHECVHVRDEMWLCLKCGYLHFVQNIGVGLCTWFYKWMHSDLKSLHYITHLTCIPMYLILLIYVRNLH